MLTTSVRNGAFFGVGLAFLGLACAKQRIQGYTTPTDFPRDDWARSIEHVRGIVADIRKFLRLKGWADKIAGSAVLELGPGATLGTGVVLAGLGAAHYQAVDAFPLARATPAGFYLALADAELEPGIDRAKVRSAAQAFSLDGGEYVSYAVDRTLPVAEMVGGRKFDLIVSNAAFEHVGDIAATIGKLTDIAAPGAVFLAMIDFQTHSRWVREHDPNSIYRFPDWLYRALSFDGQPNRCRPRDYVAALGRCGWTDTEVFAVQRAPSDYVAWSRQGLAPRFRGDDSDMEILTGAVVARRE